MTVAVFQKGGVFNVTPGPIESFIPVILFAIVFGLSMDYEVFLVSRIHEAWTRRTDPTSALIDGLGSTGQVVTAAATIMVCVFISFVPAARPASGRGERLTHERAGRTSAWRDPSPVDDLTHHIRGWSHPGPSSAPPRERPVQLAAM